MIKFKIMLALSIMMVILFGGNELYTQPATTPPECYNVLTGCNAWSPTNPELIRSFPLPGYGVPPAVCELSVRYRIRECNDPSCPGNTIKEIFIYEITFDYTDPDCEILLRSLFDDYPQNTLPNYYVFSSLYIEAYKGLARTLWLEFYQNSQNQQQYQCDEPDCMPNPCSPGNIMYYIPKCTSICWWKHDQAHMRYNTCVGGTLECCRYIQRYCYCVSTQTVVGLEEYDSVMANCDLYQPPAGGCPEINDPNDPYNQAVALPCWSLCQP